MKNMIEVKNLSKNYRDFALKKVSFEVPKGMIMGLIGENGAGKSTTIKAILNVTRRDEGEIKVFGLDNQKQEKQIKQAIGVVLDDSFLSEYLTSVDVNKIMRNFYEKWDEREYFRYVKDFKLPEKKMIKEFSSGMKMKLKIATALAHQPKLLILDEPTSGLDPVARNEILDIFADFIQDEEHSILFSSHITSDLEQIADAITFINRGEIAFVKTREEIIDQFGIVKCEQKDFDKMEEKDYLRCQKTKFGYRLLVENKAKFQKKYAVAVVERPTIEEIMVLYVRGEK